MNWLAHLFLSEPSPGVRLGNILPDLLNQQALKRFGLEIQRGIECHRRVDTFTDSHTIFQRSCRRIGEPYGRYAGILIDIFYDHCLANNWNSYSEVPLDDFASEVYRGLRTFRDSIPSDAWLRIQEMMDNDFLCSYRTELGVERALQRIQSRLKPPINLVAATCELRRNSGDLNGDFCSFFPKLRRNVASV